MQVNEQPSAASPEATKGRSRSRRGAWLAGFLLIGAGVVALGFLAAACAARRRQRSRVRPACQPQSSHSHLSERHLHGLGPALLLLGRRASFRRQLKTLSGGRWTSWKDVLTDLAIALPFWVLWEGAAYGSWRLLAAIGDAGSAKSVASLLPQSLLEILIWIAISITAGICEELAFRGYPAAPAPCAQRQHRWSPCSRRAWYSACFTATRAGRTSWSSASSEFSMASSPHGAEICASIIVAHAWSRHLGRLAAILVFR